VSIFTTIRDAIFGGPAAAAEAPTTSVAGSTAAPGKPVSTVDVAAKLDALAAKSREDFDWRRSIVDLMKMLDLDSSLKSRKELAKELGYTGNANDSATMNVWLHKQVMTKLAEHGGIVPNELKH
jgi:Domain of unknown function (DUF3597)